MAYQRNYNRYAPELMPGMRAHTQSPWRTQRGKISVPNNTTAPEPGFGVLYDTTLRQWKLPTTDAEEQQVQGVIVVDENFVQTDGLTVPDDGESPTGVRYRNGDAITVCLCGSVAVIAGGAGEWGSYLQFKRDDQKWDSLVLVTGAVTNTQLQTKGHNIFWNDSFGSASADGDIIVLSVGFGPGIAVR